MLAHEFQSYILGTSVWSYKLLLSMMVSRRHWSPATLSLVSTEMGDCDQNYILLLYILILYIV